MKRSKTPPLLCALVLPGLLLLLLLPFEAGCSALDKLYDKKVETIPAHPIATNTELQEVANGKYLRCIKEGVVASLRGSAPIVAIEFARKAIFSDERPTSDETDEACRQVKAGSGG